MRKFLVVNMNYLGDALLTTPALAALRTANPDAVIDVVVGAGAASSVLSGNPDINSITARTERGSWGRCMQLYKMLRSGRYSDVIILPPLPAYAITAFLARTPVRVGQRNRGMNRFLTCLQPTDAVHMADAMLDTMPVPPEARPRTKELKFSVDPAAEARAAKLLREARIDLGVPFAAINVGATRPQKRWFPELFAEAIELLAGLPVVLVGAGDLDETTAADVLSRLKTATAVNLVGKTSVEELAALLQKAAVLISADSGPMHLATAVGTPTVALFGSTDPKMTGPYDTVSKYIYHELPCAPCQNHPTCHGRFDCMRAITPMEVVLAARDVMKPDRKAPVRELPMVSRPAETQVLPVASYAAEAREPLVISQTAAARDRRSGLVLADTGDASAFRASAPPIKDILIVTKFRFIGDTLLAIPIFRACRAIWPNSRITLLTGKNAKRLLQNNPYLDDIIEFDPNKTDKGARSDLRLVRRLWSTHFDLSLILNRSFHSALIPWLSHIRYRAGFDCEGRGFLLTNPVEYDRDKSEILCYFDILRSIAPNAPVNGSLELWLNDEERAQATDSLRAAFGTLPPREMLVGIQPGASLPGKRWSAERFARVADMLAQEDPNVRIALIGGPDEAEAAGEMIRACADGTRDRLFSFVGRCDLRQSLGLLGHLGFFLGNDTAITHSAVALGAGTVALFGPTSAVKWGNYGDRNRVVESSDGTMAGIAVDDVIQAVRDVRAVSAQSRAYG